MTKSSKWYRRRHKDEWRQAQASVHKNDFAQTLEDAFHSFGREFSKQIWIPFTYALDVTVKRFNEDLKTVVRKFNEEPETITQIVSEQLQTENKSRAQSCCHHHPLHGAVLG